MYLRSAKTDLEDAGESVDGLVESTPKLQSLLKNVAGVDILQADGQTFKSTYQILKELSAVWDKLTDVNQASILEAIGGKRNANVTSALIKNFSEAEKVLATSQNSAGSALSENEKYLDSINGKISQLKAQFEDMSREVLSSDTVKWVADLLQNVLELADELAKVKMLLPTILSIIATKSGLGIWGTDNLGQSTFLGTTKEQRASNKYLGSVIDQSTFFGIKSPILNITSDELKSLKAFNAEIISGVSGEKAFNNHLAKSRDYVKNLGQELEAGTLSMSQLENATTGASTAMTIFNSIKSIALNVGVSVLISLVTTAISHMSRLASWEYKVEQLDKKISDSTDKIDKYQSEIDSLESAQEKLTAAKGNKEELVKVQTELNKLLGAAPDLINGEANAYDKAQQQIKDQIEVNKKMIQVEQDRVVANNKEKFKSEKVKAVGVFGDWSAKDLSFSDAGKIQKVLNDVAQSYAKQFNVSFDKAYEYVFDNSQKFLTDNDGTYSAANESTLKKRFSDTKEFEWAKKQAGKFNNIAGEWIKTVSASDWETYWNTQVSTALEVFKTTIENYQGYGGATFISNVIEGMVRDGLSLDEINTQINSAELDALNSDYFQGLINSLQEARLKGDTDAAGTALNNIKVAIDNLKKVCPSATTYLDTFWDIIANGGKTTSETTEKLNDFLEATKSLTNSFKDIDSKKSAIADMLAELRDDGKLSTGSYSTLFEDFSNVEGFENYIKVLTSSKSSTKQMQDALNGLYGAYIDSKGILNDITEDNLDYAEAQLKALGVINASDIATAGLINSLVKAAGTTGQLTAQQENCIRTKLTEKGANETLANSYIEQAKICASMQYEMSKSLSEGTKSRIKNMGIELSAIKSVADARQAMYKSIKEEYWGGNDLDNWAKGAGFEQYARGVLGNKEYEEIIAYGKQAADAEKAKAELNKLLSQVGNGRLTDISYNTSVSPTNKSGSETPEEKHKKAFDDWYANLKYRRDTNIISETQYLQELDAKYQAHFADRSKYLEEYAKYSQEVYEGFKKLYQDDLKARLDAQKEALNAQKEALEKQKDDLKELADARKKALDDAKDEEDYNKDQSEKREEINKLKVLIASFRGTLSLSSQKKLRELQQQLKEKEDELNDFEKDKALDRAKDQIDKEYESQGNLINSQIKSIEAEIKGVESQLEQINEDLPAIRDAVINFAQYYGVTITRAYASGTPSVPAITQENGAEIIAGNVKRGQFTMLTPTSKVWDANATQVLWDFANSPAGYITSVMDKISSFKQKAMSMVYSQPVNVNVGGITVNGNADNKTVEQIRRNQKGQIEEMLKGLKKLQ